MKNHTSSEEDYPHAIRQTIATAPPNEVVARRTGPEACSPPGEIAPQQLAPGDAPPRDVAACEIAPAANAADPPLCISFAPISAAESSALALSPAQRTALELLTAGKSVADSAAAAGVHRATLHRWLSQNPQFAAAHNAWQHDALATARSRLLALTDTAVTAVGRSMTKGDGRLALQLLDRMGLTTPPQPGPTDAGEVQRDQNLEQRQRKLERRKTESMLTMDELVG